MPSTTGGCDDQSSPPVTLFVADTASMLAPWRAALPQRTCTGPVSFGAGKRPSHPGSSLKLLARNLARSHQLGRAVTTDSGGRTYALEAVGLGGDSVCLYRAGDYPRGPDFPAEIVSLRLRSSAPLEVREVTWHSYDPH